MTISTFIETDAKKSIEETVCQLTERHPLPMLVAGHFLAGIACVAAVSTITLAGAVPIYLLTLIF